MQTIEAINKRFKQMKYTPATGGIVFDSLVMSLNEDETMLKLLEGNLHSSVGLIIATDLRIFFIGVNLHNETKITQVFYDDIASIHLSEPVFISSVVTLTTNQSQQLVVKGCDYNEAKDFVELIRMLTLYNNSVSRAS